MGLRSASRRIAPALGLFLLAPLVGEWLLGNQPLAALPYVLLLAPMYGGGALLIREVARRAGRGWPTMVVLAMAYALLEEGPIDQMLWNPAYGGFDLGLAYGETYVPALGTSLSLLQDVMMMHTVWSICVPIALMEALGRGDTRPWLGRFGLAVTCVVFLAGSALLAFEQAEQFMAPPGRLIGAGVVIVALIALAFVVGRRPAAPVDADAPGRLTVGVVAFAASGLYWGREFLPEEISQWLVSGAVLGLTLVFVALFARWSRSRGWGAGHRLAVAGGALLTYVWEGFVHAQETGASLPAALMGTVLLGGGAVILLWAAARGVRSAAPDLS
ncbi:hypothetical protein [Nonomuraea sediminis]|uniref:hypothetical protein n=1 Tax=Nonomuraea sediminis TaxID=2835864 RepID=UPI001BDCA015|nr:hypothetical protein [Nonomuraea sediminis]